MSKRIEDLADDFRPVAVAFLEDLSNAGIRYSVRQTLRTLAEQQAYFAQGRLTLTEVNQLRASAGMKAIPKAENTYTVTNCDGIKYPSNHQSGGAIDVVPLDRWGNPTWDTEAYAEAFVAIGEVARAHGLSCGQDWPPISAKTGLGWDAPHYERKA
jgi:hypothetical protein